MLHDLATSRSLKPSSSTVATRAVAEELFSRSTPRRMRERVSSGSAPWTTGNGSRSPRRASPVLERRPPAWIRVDRDRDGIGRSRGAHPASFLGGYRADAKLLHPDPEARLAPTTSICESTYGDTDRQETSAEHRRRMLRDEVRSAARPNGALLIPSFAVERTQELLVDLVSLMDSRGDSEGPDLMNSPLATRTREIFARHASEMEDGAALVRALNSHHVRFTESVEQSKALDRLTSSTSSSRRAACARRAASAIG